jgi:radical SAM protein with 4Fe4S-binding SPASM domain
MQDSVYCIKRDIDKVVLWKNKQPILNTLTMELTERCNNNCIHCFINLPDDDLDAEKKELSTDEIKGILQEASSLGSFIVKFTGGEPLLRDDFEELYIFARKLGLTVVIFTNATLITPHLAGLFSRLPPFAEIEITLYGMKAESYEAVTEVRGSFQAAKKGINLLLEKNIPFIVKGALLPPNKSEIDEFQAWAKTIPRMDRPPGYSMFFDLHSRLNVRKNNMIKNLRVTSEEGLKVLTRRPENYSKEMREFCAKFLRPSGDRLFSCGAGRRSGSVDAYGNLQACLLLRHPDTVYNLKNGSLKDALTNFFPKLREMKTNNLAYLGRCAKCFLKSLCEQCPAKSWIEHGTLDTPVEYLCEIAHAQAKYLGLLKGNEKAWEVLDWKERVGGLKLECQV